MSSEVVTPAVLKNPDPEVPIVQDRRVARAILAELFAELEDNPAFGDMELGFPPEDDARGFRIIGDLSVTFFRLQIRGGGGMSNSTPHGLTLMNEARERGHMVLPSKMFGWGNETYDMAYVLSNATYAAQSGRQEGLDLEDTESL